MNKTKIEWVRNSDGSKGLTWNPVTGCLGPKGDGVRCHYCYAHRLAKGRLRKRYLRNRELDGTNSQDPFAPRWAGGLLDPMGKKASRIFVCSMGDLFGDWVPDEWIDRIMATVRCSPQHTFIFLTKWPQNLARWNPWPPNAWVGGTATDEESAWLAQTHLWDVDAPVRFISFEPLLGNIDCNRLYKIRWAIVGAMTGPGAIRPKRMWVNNIIRAAQIWDTALFLKDNLNWPEKRQEFPT